MIDYKKEFEITENDLKIAYKTLFNKEGEFEEEKKGIIRSFESCRIEASPGSGKTTTLVAKLIILAEKLKKNNYDRGICILTHTNIGIDVIKEKLGSKGDILFKYPNFVGTLQSFIDNYLAIPFFKLKYKRKIEKIDDGFVNDYYFKCLEISKGLKFYLERSYVEIEDINFNFENSCFIKPNLKTPTLDNYKILYERINKGLLKFNEAIQLGNLYIREYPNLRKYFSERFFLVQVDEMQDTTEEAFEILENLFDKEKTIVQYIGDKNQNILDGNEKWSISSDKINEHYNLNSSKRFGKNIASFLNLLIGGSEICINGNPEVNDFKPILILHNFSNNDLIEQGKKIFDKFIEIIIGKGLITKLEKKEGNFKVIGRIGKEHASEITISTYFNKFSQKNLNKKNSFKSLMNKNKKNMSEIKRVSKTIENKMSCFFKILNKDKFKEYLKDEKWKLEFNKIVYEYIKERDEQKLFNSLFSFGEVLISEKLNKEIFDSIFTFLKIEKKDFEENLELDVYTKGDVNLEISTVHSVKGETHLATLYLDTFRKKYDISDYLANLVSGRLTKAKKEQTENKKIQKIIFVGASRPKYLLCFACQNTALISENKEKLENVFEIVEI